jgi:phospholipase C
MRRMAILPLVAFSPVLAGLSLTHLTVAAIAAPKIQHIVIIVKENRSFDSMFGTYPGTNGSTTYTGTDGAQHRLTHQPDALPMDVDHTHGAAITAYADGAMSGFALESGAVQNGIDEADSQFYQSDIPNYWAYAQHFTLDDNFFSNIKGPSFANHLWTIAANTDYVVDNPVIVTPGGHTNVPGWGCDSPTGTTVAQVFPGGATGSTFPCFSDISTIADRLDAAGLSWRYYGATPSCCGGYIWSAFDAISEVRKGTDWTANEKPYYQFSRDALAGRLPAVSWLTP